MLTFSFLRETYRQLLLAYLPTYSTQVKNAKMDIHRKMKISRSHTTITTKDLKKSQIEQSEVLTFSDSSSEVCPNHKIEFGFYCKQCTARCTVLVCGGCGFEKHSNHSTAVLKISEQVAYTKKGILQGTERLPEKITQLHGEDNEDHQ